MLKRDSPAWRGGAVLEHELTFIIEQIHCLVLASDIHRPEKIFQRLVSQASDFLDMSLRDAAVLPPTIDGLGCDITDLRNRG